MLENPQKWKEILDNAEAEICVSKVKPINRSGSPKLFDQHNQSEFNPNVEKEKVIRKNSF